MGRRGKNTSFEKIQLIIFHKEKGKSCRQIAEMLNMKKSTVSDIIVRFRDEDRIHLMPQSGRPRAFTPREESLIVRKVKKNPRISAPKLCTEVMKSTGKKVDPQTIRNVLKRAGFHGRVARKKPLIEERNRMKRLKFAKEFICKDKEWWKNETIIRPSEPKILNLLSSAKITFFHLIFTNKFLCKLQSLHPISLLDKWLLPSYPTMESCPFKYISYCLRIHFLTCALHHLCTQFRSTNSRIFLHFPHYK